MTHAPPPASALERYLAFAFAGADLLVEVDGNDTVIFAEGAFQARFGTAAAQFAGTKVAKLVAPDQQEKLAGALTMLRARGRLSPTPVRLSDRAGTTALVAGLARPGQGAALTFGPVPDGLSLAAGAAGERRGEMLRAAEARLRAGHGGHLTMVEVAAEGAASDAVAETVLAALAGLAPGAMADRLEEGRFGVLTDGGVAAGEARRQIQQALHDQGLDASSVAVADLDLCHGSLTPSQAVRAVRFALGRFAAGGSSALADLDGAADLPQLIAAATRRAANLRGAIGARRFALMYQPIVAIRDRRVHHHEALLRPDKSEAESPAEFVAMAEAVGLAAELDLAVAAAAVEALAASPTASVAVNVSGQSMESEPFVHGLLQVARARGKLGARLLIELTETAEIGRPEKVERALLRLREAGHLVCIDDFGAGQAGFAYLKRFATDFVKIDGHYVRSAFDGPRDRAILASIVGMTHALNCRTVAEHVETEAQATMLTELGVEFGQGWLFGKPGKSPAKT